MDREEMLRSWFRIVQATTVDQTDVSFTDLADCVAYLLGCVEALEKLLSSSKEDELIQDRNRRSFLEPVYILLQSPPIPVKLLPSFRLSVGEIVKKYGKRVIAASTVNKNFLQCTVKEVLETLLKMMEEKSKA